MNEFSDPAGFITTTINTLKSAGVDPLTIAVGLAAASVHVYKGILPTDEMSGDDMAMLFKCLLEMEV